MAKRIGTCQNGDFIYEGSTYDVACNVKEDFFGYSIRSYKRVLTFRLYYAGKGFVVGKPLWGGEKELIDIKAVIRRTNPWWKFW
jgi:hypothetical protein